MTFKGTNLHITDKALQTRKQRPNVQMYIMQKPVGPYIIVRVPYYRDQSGDMPLIATGEVSLKAENLRETCAGVAGSLADHQNEKHGANLEPVEVAKAALKCFDELKAKYNEGEVAYVANA